MNDYQEIKDILRENAIGMQELRESQKKNSEEFAEGMKDLRESQKKTDKQIEKTDKQVRRISRDFGGFINNSARETEEFFYKAIKKNNLKIAGNKFDSIYLNVFSNAHKKGHREMEIDILLLNSQVLAVVEVKTTLHQNDVKNFLEKQIPLFRACFPEHRDKKIIGMVAGKVVNDDARELAHKAGFTILTPEDGNLIVDDSCQRVLD